MIKKILCKIKQPTREISVINILELFFALVSPTLVLLYIKQIYQYDGDFISAGATISAALLAGLYVSQWKNQTKFNELLTRLLRLRQSLMEIDQEINTCREREDVYFYCRDILNNRTDSYFVKNKPVINYSNIILKLNEIRDLFIQIDLISNSDVISNQFFGKIYSGNLSISVKYNGIIKELCNYYFENFNKINFSQEKLSDKDIELMFLISDKLYSEIGWRENYKHLKPVDILNERNIIREKLNGIISEYRNWLDRQY